MSHETITSLYHNHTLLITRYDWLKFCLLKSKHTNTKWKMDKANDLKNINTPTQRRTLGMRRISPGNSLINSLNTTPKVNNSVTSTSKYDDTDSIITSKRIKLSSGRFLFNQKQRNEDENVMEKSEKAEDLSGPKDLKSENSKYNTDKKELERLIEIWSNGGKKALNQLQKEIPPEQEIDQILLHFNLPTDIFDYVISKE